MQLTAKTIFREFICASLCKARDSILYSRLYCQRKFDLDEHPPRYPASGSGRCLRGNPFGL